MSRVGLVKFDRSKNQPTPVKHSYNKKQLYNLNSSTWRQHNWSPGQVNLSKILCWSLSSELTQCWRRRRLSLGLPSAETLQSQWKVSWLISLYKLGFSTCSIHHQPFRAPWSAEGECSFRTGGPVLLMLLQIKGGIPSSSRSHFTPLIHLNGTTGLGQRGADAKDSNKKLNLSHCQHAVFGCDKPSNSWICSSDQLFWIWFYHLISTRINKPTPKESKGNLPGDETRGYFQQLSELS